jgi:hypothetical protein
MVYFEVMSKVTANPKLFKQSRFGPSPVIVTNPAGLQTESPRVTAD